MLQHTFFGIKPSKGSGIKRRVPFAKENLVTVQRHNSEHHVWETRRKLGLLALKTLQINRICTFKVRIGVFVCNLTSLPGINRINRCSRCPHWVCISYIGISPKKIWNNGPGSNSFKSTKVWKIRIWGKWLRLFACVEGSELSAKLKTCFQKLSSMEHI